MAAGPGDDSDAAPSSEEPITEWTADASLQARPGVDVRRFSLRAVEGPAKGTTWHSSTDRCSVGAHPTNDLAIEDPTVSRFHCEVWIDPKGPRVKDLGSRNGTRVDGVRVQDAWLKGGSTIRVGQTALRFDVGEEHNRVPIAERTSLGPLVGRSVAMRAAFALLERAAASDATVLIEGETGTGKELAAAAIHEAGRRREGPFVILDCGAIPPNLIESELFGHEAGAFTGATGRRIGAFEEASGGTIFLDEIGELPLDLQPKLLRVLENREVRRIGSNAHKTVDLQIIAATNRDLRALVNGGTFRSDLYYRLAVVVVRLPPLRERPEDLPLLVDRILSERGEDSEAADALRTDELLSDLARFAWPGNVRELRNYLERCLVFQEALPIGDAQTPAAAGAAAYDGKTTYAEARRRVLHDFERRYVQALLAAHDGQVTKAARAAGVDRVYIHRLARRHGIKR